MSSNKIFHYRPSKQFPYQIILLCNGNSTPKCSQCCKKLFTANNCCIPPYFIVNQLPNSKKLRKWTDFKGKHTKLIKSANLIRFLTDWTLRSVNSLTVPAPSDMWPGSPGHHWHIVAAIKTRTVGSRLCASYWNVVLLQPTNEVWSKVMFLHLSVILFILGGVGIQAYITGHMTSIQRSLHLGGLHRGESAYGGFAYRGYAYKGVCLQGVCL